ncbi:NUDIX domain-containing protein [Neobacillus mesonae]|nr:NUDIX domain-containing protein [Neobacillus mesonae]
MPIRNVALCLIQRNDEFLLEETYYPEMDMFYYRPIGGTIEPGENSKQTIIREIKEEINAEITDPELIYVIENIFTFQEQLGHEIDFIYRADLTDPTLYELEAISGMEGEEDYTAVWKSIDMLTNQAKMKLVPDGLMELLHERGNDRTKSINYIRTT